MNIIDQGFEQVFKDAYPQGAHPQAKAELRQMYFVGCAFALNQLGNKTPEETMVIVSQFRESLESFSAEPIPEETPSPVQKSTQESKIVDLFGRPISTIKGVGLCERN